MPEHLSARVSSCTCMCKWLSFCMCVSKGSSDSHVLPARQSVRPRLPRSCQAGTLGWAVPTARHLCLVRRVNLAFKTRAPRTTPSPPSSMLRLVHVLFLWCVVAVLVCLSLMLVCTCVLLRVMRAVVCHSVATVSTSSRSALANVNRKRWFATGSVQRRVTAYKMMVYVDIYVYNERADHG